MPAQRVSRTPATTVQVSPDTERLLRLLLGVARPDAAEIRAATATRTRPRRMRGPSADYGDPADPRA